MGIRQTVLGVLFARKEIPFLGFILGTKGVRPDPCKIKAIQDIPEPRSRRELQSFIGVCGYYRRFQLKYANLLDAFRQILSSKSEFKWTREHSERFQKIKDKFAECIMLRHYLSNRSFILRTDASKSGISAVLCQVDDSGEEIIIALISRCLSSYEANYSATELELLAIVFAVVRLRAYLLGTTFQIYTDHKALTFMLNTTY